MALTPNNWRNWTSGEIVTETLIQELQDQTINVETTTTRDALVVDAGSEGCVIYNTTTNGLQIYSGSAWVTIADADVMVVDSANGRVGIGTGSPAAPLDVRGQIMAHGDAAAYEGVNVGVVNIHGGVADTILDWGEGLVFTSGGGGAGNWTHGGIVGVGQSGFNGDLAFGTDGDGSQNTTGVTEKMRITHDGKVGIGTTAPDEPLHVVHTTDIARIKAEGAGSGYTQSDILLESVGSSRGAGVYTFNSGNDKTWFFGSPYSSTDEFIVARLDNAVFQESTASTGNAYLRVGWRISSNPYFASTLVYDRTTATAENVNVSSTGLIRRSTSSARYKTDIETLWDDEADKVLQLRPAWFRSTSSEDRSDWSHEGFVAEEVDKVNQRWCTYGPVFITDDDGAFITDDDGVRLTETDANGEEILQPEAVQYTRIIPALVNVVQRQQTQIDALTARITALEA